MESLRSTALGDPVDSNSDITLPGIKRFPISTRLETRMAHVFFPLESKERAQSSRHRNRVKVSLVLRVSFCILSSACLLETLQEIEVVLANVSSGRLSLRCHHQILCSSDWVLAG